ncbi:hypothetical protein HNP38_002033 [Chryseobacterium defluvii]|uniref:Uncharacterized protein n=1 Tax=Chryseobacterium defluvii TaxID=160396 RepID=A0A840KFI6_9FLAO|nr:hypothetical protein [Chryseobacterium defluvii]MBB4806737.1 hypothetical protein [Chryseobacterium defluvii]
MTPAEKRWKEKQQRIQKKIENKKNGKLPKKIDKKYKEFIDKWNDLSLLKLSKNEIIEALKGFTKHGDEVAELLKNNKMKYEFLDDADFDELLRDYDYNNELTDEIIFRTRAATLDGKTFYRSSASVEQFLTEIIHEGSHVIDNLLKKKFLKEGKTLKEIEKSIGNNWEQEIKAFSHERDWQIKIGIEPEYKSLKNIEKHVKTEYPKYLK